MHLNDTNGEKTLFWIAEIYKDNICIIALYKECKEGTAEEEDDLLKMLETVLLTEGLEPISLRDTELINFSAN